MSIKLEQVSNHEVRPITLKKDPRPIKGADICPDCYCNYFLVSPTNTGKTTVLAKLLKEKAGKDTRIICFVSTFFNDPLWIHIRKYFESRGIPIEGYTSMRDEEGDHLYNIVTELREKARERDETEDSKEETILQNNSIDLILQSIRNETQDIHMNKNISQKKKACQWQYPKMIIVFDDMSEELRNPTYNKMLKEARHLEICTFTSSQYIKDILPSSVQQMRGFILFSNIPDYQLKELHQKLSLRLPVTAFIQLYKHATQKTRTNPKPFFYILPKHDEFRRNLTHKYIIPETVYEDKN